MQNHVCETSENCEALQNLKNLSFSDNSRKHKWEILKAVRSGKRFIIFKRTIILLIVDFLIIIAQSRRQWHDTLKCLKQFCSPPNSLKNDIMSIERVFLSERSNYVSLHTRQCICMAFWKRQDYGDGKQINSCQVLKDGIGIIYKWNA